MTVKCLTVFWAKPGDAGMMYGPIAPTGAASMSVGVRLSAEASVVTFMNAAVEATRSPAVQQRRNRTNSRVRVRVAHVFATMNQMGGMFERSIGLERMRAWATMKTFSYNPKPLEALIRLGTPPIDGIGVPR